MMLRLGRAALRGWEHSATLSPARPLVRCGAAAWGEMVVRPQSTLAVEWERAIQSKHWGRLKALALEAHERDDGALDAVQVAETLERVVARSGGLRGGPARAAALRLVDVMMQMVRLDDAPSAATLEASEAEAVAFRALGASRALSSRAVSRILRVCGDPQGLAVRRGRYVFDLWLLRCGVLPRAWTSCGRPGGSGEAVVVPGWQALSLEGEGNGWAARGEGEGPRHALAEGVLRLLEGGVGEEGRRGGGRGGVEDEFVSRLGVVAAATRLFARAGDARAALTVLAMARRVGVPVRAALVGECVKSVARRRDHARLAAVLRTLGELDLSAALDHRMPAGAWKRLARGRGALARTQDDVEDEEDEEEEDGGEMGSDGGDEWAVRRDSFGETSEDGGGGGGEVDGGGAFGWTQRILREGEWKWNVRACASVANACLDARPPFEDAATAALSPLLRQLSAQAPRSLTPAGQAWLQFFTERSPSQTPHGLAIPPSFDWLDRLDGGGASGGSGGGVGGGVGGGKEGHEDGGNEDGGNREDGGASSTMPVSLGEYWTLVRWCGARGDVDGAIGVLWLVLQELHVPRISREFGTPGRPTELAHLVEEVARACIARGRAWDAVALLTQHDLVMGHGPWPPGDPNALRHAGDRRRQFITTPSTPAPMHSSARLLRTVGLELVRVGALHAASALLRRALDDDPDWRFDSDRSGRTETSPSSPSAPPGSSLSSSLSSASLSSVSALSPSSTSFSSSPAPSPAHASASTANASAATSAGPSTAAGDRSVAAAKQRSVEALARALLAQSIRLGDMRCAASTLRRMEAAGIAPDVDAAVDAAAETLVAAGHTRDLLQLVTHARQAAGWTPTAELVSALALVLTRARRTHELRSLLAALIPLPAAHQTHQTHHAEDWDALLDKVSLRGGAPVPVPGRAACRLAALLPVPHA